MESVDAKRLRLSKAYLDKLEVEQERVAGHIDAEELDREIIASRLQQDAVCREWKWLMSSVGESGKGISCRGSLLFRLARQR